MLEHLHIDLIGSMQVSIGGKRFSFGLCIFFKLLLLFKKKKKVYSLLLVVYVPWVDYSK